MLVGMRLDSVAGRAGAPRRAVAGDGITVNTVLPGRTDTERLRKRDGAGADAGAALAKVGAGLPLGRLTRPQELGDVVAFLASEGASAITGSAIAVEVCLC